jgi:DNA repair protein RecN (Recombination protein N)
VIESIGIKNLGVIESAELSLNPGFTALTGETGAGKTMVLNALNLLLGGRADSNAVRRNQPSLLVEGSWLISDRELQDRIQESGAIIEDSLLLVNRSVTADGRSRAALGGVQVPAGTLAEISEQLVTVHGQSDQLRLRSTTAQRDALDEFGGSNVAAELAAYSSTYISYKELTARLERHAKASSQDQARLAEVRDLISQIQKLDPEPGELAELEEKINRLSNVEHLQQAASLAHDALTSDDQQAALQLLAAATRSLEHSNDPILGELGSRLAEIGSLASDVSAELASYLVDLEADPAQLDALNSRKSAIVQLERRHGKTADELLAQLPSLHAELLDLDSSDEQLEKLEMQLAALEAQLSHAARALTAVRQAAAERLTSEVSQELSQLAMSGVRFSVAISQLGDFEASGIDRIEFMLANAGAEPRPIAKGASGGELSRIMLAIELVLVASRPLPTMIFDEVDAGVGGQAALELGRRLKKLSERTQVIVVTHLPQVAAFADHQIQVTKDSSGEVTTSSVRTLSTEERRIELARMLSGNPDSEVALAHADELLNLA